MTDICRACALRAQRTAASALRRQVQTRAFTASAAQRKNTGVPAFSETANPDLDDVLLSLRNNHFIPAYLNVRQRRLIFSDKHKTELENNPSYATLGDEEVPLTHMDRRRDIPAKRPLVKKALELMREPEDWKQLPSLLEGLTKTNGKPDVALQEKVIRKAIEADQFSVVLRCLRRSYATGMTLKNDTVLNQVLWGLHRSAQLGEWDEKRLRKAIRQADELAQLLEADDHGSGRKLSQNDPRTRPATIGVYLELAAVNSYKFYAGRDHDGSVKKYADRLMACFQNSSELGQQQATHQGPQYEIMSKLPVWHGLNLTKNILGGDVPQSQKAQKIVQDYESRLSQLIKSLDAQAPSLSYPGQALDAWNACIRP
ncbi:hypothetical protein MBLNU459_g3231t1 [Dothideomycetes sp. NU459]